MLFLDKLVVLSLTEKEEKMETVCSDIQYIDIWLRFIYRRINKYDIYARAFLSLRYIREENDWVMSREGRKERAKLLYECKYKGVNYLWCDASYLRRPLMPLDRSERCVLSGY